MKSTSNNPTQKKQGRTCPWGNASPHPSLFLSMLAQFSSDSHRVWTSGEMLLLWFSLSSWFVNSCKQDNRPHRFNLTIYSPFNPLNAFLQLITVARTLLSEIILKCLKTKYLADCRTVSIFSIILIWLHSFGHFLLSSSSPYHSPIFDCMARPGLSCITFANQSVEVSPLPRQ